MYIVLIVLWVVLTAVWLFMVHMVFPDTVLPVSRTLLSLLPVLRVLTAGFSLLFWWVLTFVCQAHSCIFNIAQW